MTKKTTRIANLLAATACWLAALVSTCQGQQLLARKVKAPPLDLPGQQWINTSGPIRISDLRGKFVVLDFWTYCCINCKHILPELKKLEREFGQKVVVIGVHSPKFATERDVENVREAVVRYDIEHPVVNDATQALWRRYQADMWPTLRFIDPDGYVFAVHKGEITFEQLQRFFRRQIAAYERRKPLDSTPLRFRLERERVEATPLRYPGKVAVDAAAGRLVVADSSHHRIVVASLDGQLQRVIGRGLPGDRDGDFATARFRDPQGMAIDGDLIYVADTENHKIRKIDLAAGKVETIAGTGTQRKQAVVRGGMTATSTELASPWDVLLLDNGRLMIAMAGTHQIWQLHLSTGKISAYAGSGTEDIVDGGLLPRTPYGAGASAFAQPSGLASDGRFLFVADSEGSSIRVVPLGSGRVQTLVGTSALPNARLFTFGDRDGPLSRALLQHPIGVAYQRGQLFVADTYNNKIRWVDLARSSITTLIGDDQLDEPAGVAAAGNRLWIADTNNHLVRQFDLTTKQLSTLNLQGLEPPAAEAERGFLVDPLSTSPLPATAVRARGKTVPVEFRLQLAAGSKLDEQAPMAVEVRWAAAAGLGRGVQRIAVQRQDRRLLASLPVSADQGASQVELTLQYFYCRDGQNGFCRPGVFRWKGQLQVRPDGAETLSLAAVER